MRKISEVLLAGLFVLAVSMQVMSCAGVPAAGARKGASEDPDADVFSGVVTIPASRFKYPERADYTVTFDKKLSVPEKKLPVIKIESTENNHSLAFAAVPVSHHVKDAQKSWWDFSNNNTPDPWYEKCNISVDDKLVGKGQVKVRGNWTTSYEKKSFRIKFDDKQKMLGLNNGKAFKNWVLLSCYKDASMLRDAAALKMYKTLFPEYYASDCQLVEVYINDVYWGVYLLAEQQETKKNRIGITEPEKNSADTNIGYFIEYDTYYTSEVSEEVFEIDYRGKLKDYDNNTLNQPQKGYTIKSDITNPSQRDFIAGYMNRLWKICYDASYNKKYYRFNAEYRLEEYTPEGSDDDERCRNCISEIIDLKSLADMYIFNELICDPDLYLTSFLMDIDFGEGGDKLLRFEAPWDFDSTMGNKRHCADAQGMFAGKTQYEVNFGEKGYANPWMVIFINQSWFQKLVQAEWQARDVEGAKAAAVAVIEKYTGYSDCMENNRTRWGNPGDNEELNPASQTAAKASQAAAAAYLKDWLKKRFTAVDSVISGLTTK